MKANPPAKTSRLILRLTGAIGMAAVLWIGSITAAHASTYGSGTYNAAVYDGTSSASAASPTSSARPQNGSLAPTGVSLAAVTAVGVLGLSLPFLFVWLRKNTDKHS